MALINCPECNKEISELAHTCPNCGCPIDTSPEIINTVELKHRGFWSSGRLTIGIISIILSIIAFMQSCAVGVVDAMGRNESNSADGIGFSIWFLAAGIVGICTRNSRSKTGPVITAILYYMAFYRTWGNSGNFSDLATWGLIAGAFGIVFLICSVKTKKY